jgi:hypothetical protein
MSVQISTDIKEHDLTHIHSTNGAMTTPHTGSIQYDTSNGLIRSSNRYSAVQNTDLNFRDGKRKESQMLAQLASKDTTVLNWDIKNTSVSDSQRGTVYFSNPQYETHLKPVPHFPLETSTPHPFLVDCSISFVEFVWHTIHISPAKYQKLATNASLKGFRNRSSQTFLMTPGK